MGLFGTTQSELIEMFKKNDDGYVDRQFNFRVEEAKESQQKRYSIDTTMMNQFANLAKGLKMAEIQRGLEMQNEKGPQKDWAIAGGIASGLLGGAAGVAVAATTMQENIESTRKHHETGRKMVESGINGIETISKDMEKVNQIAVNINSSDYFEYTDVLPDLIKCFESETVSIDTTETVRLVTSKMFGGVEIHQLSQLKAYNSIGFFRAKFSIKNNFHDLFPSENDKQIDGAFKISLYDGDNEIAYSYVFGDNWSVDKPQDVGFKKRFERTATFKLVDKQITIKPSKKYTAKFSEPNLWLVKPLKKNRR